MTWLKLDDKFPTHPKIVAAGGDAAWLHVCALCYCAEHLTDGLIAKNLVPRLSDRRRPSTLAQRLVDVGIWLDEGESYRLHDYLDFNPSRLTVELERAGAKERREEARSSPNVGPASPERRASVNGPVPVPDVPTERSEGAPSGASPRGSRIPDDFLVTDEMQAWVKNRCPDIDWQLHTENFVDWAKSTSSRAAVKKDWVRAWKTWMRREQDRIPAWAKKR